MNQIYKYPRTPHLEGSKFQNGDSDKDAIPISELNNKYLVVEEKMDGANSGISFEEGDLYLQSRGHYLTGGYREKHFDLFKSFAYNNIVELRDLLGDRYIMYGEWLYAKHTIFYDALPDYFMEFDIFDKLNKVFLSTYERMEMLKNHPYNFIKSVDVIKTIEQDNLIEKDFSDLITKSSFITDDRFKKLQSSISGRNLDYDIIILKETDQSDLMEGLYIKWEEDGIVKGRYKYVRASFLQTVVESNSHWLNRPIIKNLIN